MQRFGFIQDELSRKTLILYVLSRAGCAVSFEHLTEMAMCDDGMDYFQYSSALEELVASGHILRTDDGVSRLYKISPKGAQNLAICENQLPSAARGYADEGVARVLEEIGRAEFISAELREEDGAFSVTCRMKDDAGELVSMRLRAASRKHGEVMAKNFRRSAEDIYSRLIADLSREGNPG